jgi:hypothetical protein
MFPPHREQTVPITKPDELIIRVTRGENYSKRKKHKYFAQLYTKFFSVRAGGASNYQWASDG